MRASASDPRYQRVPVNVCMSLWRRKWWGFAILLSCTLLVLVTYHRSKFTVAPIERDAYLDDVSEDVYQDVLRRWYNFTNGNTWYNDKELSPFNADDWERYLNDIRQNWIVWRHNSNQSYVLQSPDINDPSMGQARVIREILNDKENGFFVECGAYDGETRSNTLVFERFFGWKGLLIEADPINFSKMLGKNRRAYLSPTCISITSRPTVASFLMARNVGRLHEPHNSTKDKLQNSHDVAHSGTHIRVQCFPFAHYMAALGIETVDYFSLDIEGNEVDVLETIPFDKLDIKNELTENRMYVQMGLSFCFYHGICVKLKNRIREGVKRSRFKTLSVEHVHNTKSRKYLIDLMEARGYYVHSFVERSDNLANDVIFVKRDS